MQAPPETSTTTSFCRIEAFNLVLLALALVPVPVPVGGLLVKNKKVIAANTISTAPVVLLIEEEKAREMKKGRGKEEGTEGIERSNARP